MFVASEKIGETICCALPVGAWPTDGLIIWVKRAWRWCRVLVKVVINTKSRVDCRDVRLCQASK